MSVQPERVEGERERSDTASSKRRMKPLHQTALFGLGAMSFVAFVFYRDGTKKADEPPPPQATQIGMVVPAPPPPEVARAMPAIAPPAWARPPNPAPQESLAAALPAKEASHAGTGPGPKRMLSYGGGTATPAAAREPAPTPAPAPATVADAEQSGMVFKAGRIPGIKAGPAMDMTFMLMPGVIKCVLSNAIDTTQPGPIFCATSEAAKSPAGVTLMEKGTQITGSYSSGVQQGQARMPAVTAFAITPNGVPIALSAPFGDALGRAGLTGEVDNHTMARFGGALLLMASQGAIQVAQSALQGQGRGNSYTSLNVGGVQSAVAETLRNTVNIAPTIPVAQGTEVGLLVTQPIDFSDAYELRAAR